METQKAGGTAPYGNGLDSPATNKQKAGVKPAFCLFVRPGRIELPTNPWQGLIIPLNHGRNLCVPLLLSAEKLYPLQEFLLQYSVADYSISSAMLQ